MSTETGMFLRVSRLINADPETVFHAWTEPDEIKRWSCPEGGTVLDVDVDLSINGRYRIHMKTADGKEHTALGAYREIEPPHRLVYTWDWAEDEHRVGRTLVTVEFNDRGGSTEVVLTHEGFPGPEAKVGHEKGWTSTLNRLERTFG